MIHIQNYINGGFTDPIKNEWLDNICPADGLVYGKLPNSCTKDVKPIVLLEMTTKWMLKIVNVSQQSKQSLSARRFVFFFLF